MSAVRGAVWRCSFCDQPGKRSGEHVIGQLLHPHVGSIPPSRTTYGAGFGLNSAASAYVEAEPMRRVSQNSLLQQVTRTVCKKCNESWLGRLETAALPHLLRLFEAARPGSESAKISPSVATLLARWAVKTSWTSELASLGDQNQYRTAMPQQMRLDFIDADTPPAAAWVWLAFCRDPDVHPKMQFTAQIDRTSPPDGRRPRRLLASYLMLRGVVFLSYSFEVRSPLPPPLPPLHAVRLWPHPAPSEFPQLEVGQNELMSAITSCGSWLPTHPTVSFDNESQERPAGWLGEYP